MVRQGYEKQIAELEAQLEFMRERCWILEELTSALLFEYRPAEDKMVFIYNYPDNRSRRVIERYHEYVRESARIHSDYVEKVLGALEEAGSSSVKKEITYLCRTPEGEYQWYTTVYASVRGEEDKISYVLGRISNVNNSIAEKQDIIRRLETDFLTGLYNKGAATEKISEWLKNNPDGQAHMIMLDLDDFKGINDTYGHAFGDEVLRETARVMRDSFTRSSILSRFGGDEFIIFVTEESIKTVEAWIDEMMRKMAVEIVGMEWPLHCSVGITARISPEDDFEALFNRADNVMYVAKNKGRNRYFVDRRHAPRVLKSAAVAKEREAREACGADEALQSSESLKTEE